jgi:hypothetical protein
VVLAVEHFPPAESAQPLELSVEQVLTPMVHQVATEVAHREQQHVMEIWEPQSPSREVQLFTVLAAEAADIQPLRELAELMQEMVETTLPVVLEWLTAVAAAVVVEQEMQLVVQVVLA